MGLDLCPCPGLVRGRAVGVGGVGWLACSRFQTRGRNSDGPHHISSLSGPLFLSWAMMELPRECAQNAESQAPTRHPEMDSSGRGLGTFILTTCSWLGCREGLCPTTLPWGSSGILELSARCQRVSEPHLSKSFSRLTHLWLFSISSFFEPKTEKILLVSGPSSVQQMAVSDQESHGPATMGNRF